MAGNTSVYTFQEKGPAPRILFIDNDADNVKFLQGRLLDEGVHVEVTSDGEQGIKTAQDIKPDMIILGDLTWASGMNAVQVRQRLRYNLATRDIYILMLIADKYILMQIVKQGIMVNSYAVNPEDVDGAVTKPYNTDKLLKLIRSLLRRQRWRRVARRMGKDEMIGFDF